MVMMLLSSLNLSETSIDIIRREYNPTKPFHVNNIIKQCTDIQPAANSIKLDYKTLIYAIYHNLDLCDLLCKQCKTNYRRLNHPGKLNDCCCVSCSNIFRGPLTLSLTKEQKELQVKSRVENGHKKGPDGLTRHQRISIVAANSRRHKQKDINKTISMIKEAKRNDKQCHFDARLQKIKSHFGFMRFYRLFGKLNKLSFSRFKFISSRLGFEDDVPQYTYKQFYYVFISKQQVFHTCIVCGMMFSNVGIDNIKYSTSKQTCSKSCSTTLSWKKGLRKGTPISQKRKSEISQKMKVIHSKKTKDQKRVWSDKIISKMKDTLIGGKNLIEIRTERALITKMNRNLINSIYKKTDYDIYKNKCVELTNKCDLHLLDNFKSRGSINKLGLSAYHLDHIFPISKGFLYHIPPELIGDIRNLCFVPAVDNLRKSNKILKIPNHIKEYLSENQIII